MAEAQLLAIIPVGSLVGEHVGRAERALVNLRAERARCATPLEGMLGQVHHGACGKCILCACVDLKTLTWAL